MTLTSIELPNLMEPDMWLRPYDETLDDLTFLREEAPVAWFPGPARSSDAETGYWGVFRYDDVVTVSRDPETYSSAGGVTLPDIPDVLRGYLGSMIAMDDPRHARLRRLMAKGFTPKSLHAVFERVQEVANEVIDEIDGRHEIDFVADVAAAMPLRIVCELMGIPARHYDFALAQTNLLLGATDRDILPAGMTQLQAQLAAAQGLAELMHEVVESKRGGDGTDLTSQLINAELDDDRLDADDLASFFVLLVAAGNETTRTALSWGLVFLTDHPDQRAAWASDFDAVSPTAVDEIVRLATPITYMRRLTTTDTTLRGVDIPAGSKVCVFYHSANRDPEVFADPLAFDVRRPTNPPQAGFGGFGPHFCMGAHLARREIQVMFGELFRRLPDIHASGPPELLRSSFVRGIKHLPATW